MTEIIISAPNAVVNGNRDTGSIYIVKGGIGNRTINVDSSSFDLVVRIDGESLFSRFGFSIACVGDIDCDQKPDFAVGAPLADTGTLTLAGKVYILYGRDINSSSTLVNSTIFEGYENSQGYGTSLAVKNGRLLIGAPRTNKDTGRTYLVDLYTGQIITE
ncbi:hypothetical protein HY745_00610 [Candidatus Desantisbacteria bacterium]|nr:hypothetical protein [Candidatus Desantisbacteria bacterium]